MSRIRGCPSVLSLLVAAPLVLAAADTARAQVARDDAFVVLVAGDTFAVENVSRSPDRVESEITGHALGRLLFGATLTADGIVQSLTLRAWMPGVPSDAAPMQEVQLTLDGDTVFAEVTTAAGAQSSRIATREHAILYLNPSLALMDQVLDRARVLGGATADVPVFFLQGGQTVVATVAWPATDSAVIELGGVQMHAVVGSDDRIRRVAVPAQNLTATRVDGMHLPPVAFTPPDYSAPEGAPYTAEEVVVETPAGHSLAGTLTRPHGHAAVPAVVMITGSGAQDRDEAIATVRGYRPFREIADTLARAGIAVLRLDDRGFGGSTGDFAAATSADFADDIRAALAWLRGRPDIDGDRLGLIGHSEGGLIAPLVAAGDTLLRGIVLIAGPSRSGRSIIEDQQRYAIERSPVIQPASRDSALAAAQQQTEAAAAQQPWLRFFLDHDPLTVVPQVRVPVLILQGETDRQVTAEQAVELATAFRDAGNTDVTMRAFPGINHLMLPDADGNPAGYTVLPERRVAPEVLGAIVDWVVARLP